MKFTRRIANVGLCFTSYPVGKSMKRTLSLGRVMAKQLAELYGKHKLRLVCAGSSGSILSAIIASSSKLKVVEIVHIKKEGERSHHEQNHIDRYNVDAYNIIVDDFISSGGTIIRIYDKFKDANPGIQIKALIFAEDILLMDDGFSHMEIEDLICKYEK